MLCVLLANRSLSSSAHACNQETDKLRLILLNTLPQWYIKAISQWVDWKLLLITPHSSTLYLKWLWLIQLQNCCYLCLHSCKSKDLQSCWSFHGYLVLFKVKNTLVDIPLSLLLLGQADRGAEPPGVDTGRGKHLYQTQGWALIYTMPGIKFIAGQYFLL